MVVVFVLAAAPGAGFAAQGPLPRPPQPTLDLSSAFSRQGDTSNRATLSQLLRVQSHERPLSYWLALGWSWLAEGQESSRVSTTTLSNLDIGGRHHFQLGAGRDAAVGVEVFFRITSSSPTVHQRTFYNAQALAMAMDGLWNAWLWAPGPVGFAFPLQASWSHALGPWWASASGEAAFAYGVPRGDPGQPSLGTLLQARGEYQVSPRPWLHAGAGAQIVVLPNAALFRAQSALRALVAVTPGRWRVGTEVLVNLDEPYGWGPRGLGVWALHVHLGVAL